MNSMFKGIAAKLISHLCGQYLGEIDSSQLILEMWNGKVQMENLKVMENSFLAHHVPFRVKRGMVGSLSLSFPWSKLSSEPCIVNINDLFLVGEVYGGALVSQDLMITNTAKQQGDSGVTEESMWNGMLTKILDNLIVNIQNIHIRIEAKTEAENYMAIGVVVPSIDAFTIDELGQKIFLLNHPSLLRKKVTINNFGVYVDTDVSEIDTSDTEMFKFRMNDDITNGHHQFIIEPFTFDGIYMHNFLYSEEGTNNDSNNNDLVYETAFSMISKAIEISVDSPQFRGMQVLLHQYKLFCKQRLYSHCGRPDRQPRSQRSSCLWWGYAHRCSITKKEKETNSKILFDANSALEILKNRKKYFEIWSKQVTEKDSVKILNDFEETLESNTVTHLRVYSMFMGKIKEKSVTDDLTQEEIDIITENASSSIPFSSVLSLNNKDYVGDIADNNTNNTNLESTSISSKRKKGPLQFILELNSLKFSLKENQNRQTLSCFLINECKTKFIKKGFENFVDFSVKSFSILNNMSKLYNKTFEAPLGITDGKVKFNYNEPYQISLKVSPIFAVVDVEWISFITKFFKQKRKFIQTDNEKQMTQQIQAVIDQHSMFYLDLEIGKSKIIVPYQEIDIAEVGITKQPSFDFSFNSFKFCTKPPLKYDASNVNTLFDNYHISVRGIYFVFAEKKMSDLFDVNASFDIAIVTSELIESMKGNIEFTQINLYTTTFQGLLFKELCSYISDSIKTEKSKNIQHLITNTQKDIIKPNHTPANKVSINIPSISLLLSYEEKPLYKITMNKQTIIDISNKDRKTCVSIINDKSGIELNEFISNQTENNKFFKGDKFKLFLELDSLNKTNNINLVFDETEVFAKSKPINFLVVFAKSPKNFEWKLKYKEFPTITKYLHKKKPIKDSTQLDNPINKSSSSTKVVVDINNTKAHLLDSKGNDEILNIDTKNINVSVDVDKNDIFIVSIGISPPKISSTALGPKWKTIGSLLNPINIKITPVSVDVDVNNGDINFYPLFLIDIINFALEAKKTHSHIPGDPDTMPYMKFNINVNNIRAKIIYDLDSNDFYDLKVPSVKFQTVKAPENHQVLIDKVEMLHHSEKILYVENINVCLDMNFLLKENTKNQNNLPINEKKTFSAILKTKDIKTWSEETIRFINENEKNLLVLNDASFYFYKLSLNIIVGKVFVSYSHSFARNATFITSSYSKSYKKKPEIVQNNQNHINDDDEYLEINSESSIDKVEIVLFNQKPMTTLMIEKAFVKTNDVESSYYAKFNEMTMYDNINNNKSNIDENSKETNQIVTDENKNVFTKMIEAKTFELSIEKDKILTSLNTIDSCIELSSIPIIVDYVMNCPFFSFADEFKSHKTSKTSLEFTKNVSAALGHASISIPINSNSIVFDSSFTLSFTPSSRTAEVKGVKMILKDKTILEPFSIVFVNDEWSVDPILLSFSIFEFSIVEQFIDKLNRMKMPKIYKEKKDVELSHRSFVVNTPLVQFVLSQPTLPFIMLEIKPSVFKQTYDLQSDEKYQEFRLEPFLEHANYSTCGYDSIIDPFVVSLKSTMTNSTSSSTVDFSPIHISVSAKFLQEIVNFRRKYELYKEKKDISIFQKECAFIQNDTGVSIEVFNEVNKEKFILENDNPHKISKNGNIIVSFLDKKVSFMINDLYFPIFFDKTAVVYLEVDIGVQTVHFSSPFLVQNDLKEDMEVFVADGNQTIGIVPQGKRKPIPLNMINNLSKGLKARLTKQTMSCSTPPLRIYSWNSSAFIYKLMNNETNQNLTASARTFVDTKYSIGIIAFSSLISFFNELPVPVKIMFMDSNINNIADNFFGYKNSYVINIDSGKTTDASFIQSSDSSLTIKLIVDGYGESSPTMIFPFDAKPVPREFVVQNPTSKCRIAVSSEYSAVTMSSRIVIFSPCVMFNETGIPLHIKEKKNDDEINPFNNKMYLFGSKKYFKKKKLTGRIVQNGKTFANDRPFDCFTLGTVQTLLLPYKENVLIYLPIAAILSDAPREFNNTTVMTFSTILSVYNHFDVPIYLSPSGTEYSTECLPKSRSSILYSNSSFTFDIFVEGYQKCGNINISTQTTTVFRLLRTKDSKSDFLIEIDAIKEKSGYCGHFSYPSLPTPFVITNMIENKAILVFQENDKHSQVVNKLSTSLFASDQPFGNQRVQISISETNIVFPVSFESDCGLTKIGNSQYYFQVTTTKRGSQMILVSEYYDPNEIKKKPKKKTIDIFVNKLSVSFIDDMMRELCVFTMTRLIYQLTRQNSIEMSIDSIQFDDTYVAAKMPVVLCVTHPRLLQLVLKGENQIQSRSFKSLDVNMNQLHLFADLSFINDLYTAIRAIYKDSKIETKFKPALTNRSTSNDINNMNNNNFSDNENGNGNEKIMKRRKKETDPNYIKSSSFYSFNSLAISPLSLSFNFRGTSGRPYIYAQSEDLRITFVSLIPNVSAAPIEIPAMQFQNLRAPLTYIRKSLLEGYKAAFLKKIWSIVGHADLLLNAVGIAKSFKAVLTDDTQTKKESLKNAGGQILQGTEGVVRSLSSLVHMTTDNNKNQKVRKVFGGIANLLEKGANKISNVKQELTQETIPGIQRYARAFPMLRIRPKPDRASLAQNSFQKVMPNERLLAIVDYKANQFALAVFDHYAVVLSQNLMVVIRHYKLTEIKKFDIREKTIKMATSDTSPSGISSFEFSFEKENEARSVAIIVQSIIDRMQLFLE